MKLLLPTMMLFLGVPLFAQTRVLIDNTTDHEVDTHRIRRLTEKAVAHGGGHKPTIICSHLAKDHSPIENRANAGGVFRQPEPYLHARHGLSRIRPRSASRDVS